MTLIMKSEAYARGDLIAANMHRDRKRVFVDLLKWEVPVINGEFEIDQFDDASAVYLICADDQGNHRGSIRLLPTNRPHILGTLFPDLCEGPVPTGPNIYEITRCCFSPRIRATERLRVRNQLATAAVEFALFNGIDAFTCVADGGWYSQILAMGWMCEPLGLPRLLANSMTGALKISITRDTPRLLLEAGIYSHSTLELATPALLAA
jgi:N-acyl-L-homoserine lactone synthetase